MIHPSNLISGTWKSAPGPSVFSKKSTVACNNVEANRGNNQFKGCTSFATGEDNKGKPQVSSIQKLEQQANKQDQTRCLRDPRTKKDTEVTTF